jgi:hypothetical protein
LLPGGANQFPGGFNSRCGPPPFTAHPVTAFTRRWALSWKESYVDDWSWNYYYLKMDMPPFKNLRIKPFCTTVVFLVFSLLFASCRRSEDKNFVVVRVFRDASSDFSRELDRKLYGFNDQHRVSSGKLIVVATEEGDYQNGLAEKIALVKPQIIILDSPADAKLVRGGIQFDLRKAKSVCGSDRNCPAFIPPWVSGERLEATNMLFSAITQE